MAVNTRFATGVHALVLLAADPQGVHTSQDIARKLHTNPVVIRRVFSLLQQAELVESQKGPNGGSRLARPAKNISLADIYRALETSSVFHEAAISGATRLNGDLAQVFRSAQKALEKELSQTTLAHLAKRAGKKPK